MGRREPDGARTPQRPHTGPLAVARCALFLGFAATAWLQALPAIAYEDQWTLEIESGWAREVHTGGAERGQRRHGPALGLGAGLGVAQAWSLRSRLEANRALDPGSDAVVALSWGAEALYLVDVLAWVPFVGLGAQLRLVAPGGSPEPRLLALVGVDHLWSRAWLVGAEVRSAHWPGAPSEWSWQACLRLSRVFDLY